MNSYSTHRNKAWTRLAVVPLLVFGFGLAQRPVQAAAPKANTPIGNQATATYSDGSDTQRTAQSNTVTTTVQQVSGVDLQNDNSEIRPAGSPIYFPHSVINNGNGTDTFDITIVESTTDNFNIGALVYADLNGDGRPDSSTPLADTDGDGFPNTPSLEPGAIFKFVVGGTVPSTTSAGNTGTITVTAKGNTTNPAQDSNTDTVTVTNFAAVSVLKKEDRTQGAPGSTITYTLEYVNNGDQPANDLVLTDTLGAGLSYTANSGKWSASGTDLTDAAAGDPSGIDYSVVGNNLTGPIFSVPARSNGRITFKVTVPSGTAPGSLANVATFAYDDDGSAATAKKTGTSNTVNFQVDSAPVVSFAGETKTTATQGDTILFKNTVTNGGNGSDVFDIVVNGPGSFPAGTSFKLLQKDGATSMLDTDGDQVPDTGPVAAGTTYDVYLAVTLPSTASGNNGGSGFQVTKTATSNATGTPTATATDKLNSITAATVNLTNNVTLDDGNPATGIPVVTKTGAPGTTQSIILNVSNPSTKSDTFSLAYSTTNNFATPTSIPPGFTLVFKDSNGAIVSDTGVIAAGATKTFTVEVTIPAGASPQNIDLFFRALSPSTGAQDTILDRVTVNRNRSVSVTPNNAGEVYPNSSVLYSHTITNTGNATETDIAVATGGDANGFSSVSYLDANGNGELDGTEANTPLTSITSIAAGGSVKIITKVFGPGSAVATGVNNVSTITVSLDGDLVQAGNQVGGPNSNATDTTTLVVGDVRLEKFQAIDTDGPGAAAPSAFTKGNANALPGQYLRYKIVVTNTGGARVTSIVVSDTTPTYTAYWAGDGSNSETTGKAVWSTTDVNGATVVTAASTAPTDGVAGKLVFTIPALNPGQTATLTFGVRIAN